MISVVPPVIDPWPTIATKIEDQENTTVMIRKNNARSAGPDGTARRPSGGGRDAPEKRAGSQTETELDDPEFATRYMPHRNRALTEGEQPGHNRSSRLNAGRPQRPFRIFRDHIDTETRPRSSAKPEQAEADGDGATHQLRHAC